MPRAWLILAFTFVLASLALAQSGHPVDPPGSVPKPAIFSDISYADGLAANKANGKVFVVKATAAWCGPCKAMNRTTMVDPRVIKWFGDNGTIIEFDVDKDTELAKTLNVSAMPTAIAFKDGKEFDRTIGLRNAESFIDWLDGVKAGKHNGDDLQVKIEKANNGDGKVSIHERLENARTLLNNNSFDKATTEYLWLWQNMAAQDPSMVGVRGSFMAGDIKRLVEKHAPAKEQFAKIRNEAWATYTADSTKVEQLDDWLVLNDTLSDDTRTLEWFDRAKADPSSTRAIEREGFRLERVLTEHNRIADICLLYPDPIAKLRTEDALRHGSTKLADPDQAKMIREIHDKLFRDRAATLYTSLLLAKRDNDAAAFAAESLKLDDTGPMRTALVRAALDNQAARSQHTQWLEEAAKSGETTDDLKAKLERQLGASGK